MEGVRTVSTRSRGSNPLLSAKQRTKVSHAGTFVLLRNFVVTCQVNKLSISGDNMNAPQLTPDQQVEIANTGIAMKNFTDNGISAVYYVHESAAGLFRSG